MHLLKIVRSVPCILDLAVMCFMRVITSNVSLEQHSLHSNLNLCQGKPFIPLPTICHCFSCAKVDRNKDV